MIWCRAKYGALLALVAVACLMVLPSCIIVDDWGHGRSVSYAIRWYNNSPHDVDVYVGGVRVIWIDGGSWLYAWQELPSDTSFDEGTYPAEVFDHWSGILVSQGSIYIGPGNQEFVTLR